MTKPCPASNAEVPGTSDRAVAFARLLENGDYRALFGRQLDSIFAQASKQMQDSGLGDEIGALRFVLARLIAEEEDLNRLAINVARIVSVAVRAAQTQRTITGQSADVLVEELKRILDEIDPETTPESKESP